MEQMKDPMLKDFMPDDFRYLMGINGFDYESIMLNKASVEKSFAALLPNTTVHFVNRTNLFIHPDTGTVLERPDVPFTDDVPDVPYLYLLMSSHRFRSGAEFASVLSSTKHIYVHSIREVTPGGSQMEIVLAKYSPGKKKNVTFTIDEGVAMSFNEVCDRMAINKSKFVENYIKDFVQKNK